METLTPIKSIRAKCLDCCGGSSNEVSLCNSKDCSLHSYRFGKRPIISHKTKKISKTPSRLMVSEKLKVFEQEDVI